MSYEGSSGIRRLAIAGFVSSIGSEMAFIALAFVVGFIVISVMLPILETSTSIQRR